MNVGPAISIARTSSEYHHRVVVRSVLRLAVPPRPILRLFEAKSTSSNRSTGEVTMTGRKMRNRWMNRRVVPSGSTIQVSKKKSTLPSTVLWSASSTAS